MATTGDENERDRTLHIRFRTGDDEQLQETLAALDRGERPEPHFEVVYHDPADLHQVTRPNSLALLRAIARHEPASIRETARLVDRDVSQVHRNLQELADLHLIELVDDGHASRPVVWYDSIAVDLPLLDSETEGTDEAVS